jgi:hypothetical protein
MMIDGQLVANQNGWHLFRVIAMSSSYASCLPLLPPRH